MYNKHQHYLLIIETYLKIEFYRSPFNHNKKTLCTRSNKESEDLKKPDTWGFSHEYGEAFFPKKFPLGGKRFWASLRRFVLHGVTNDQIMPRRGIHKCIFQRSKRCKSER